MLQQLIKTNTEFSQSPEKKAFALSPLEERLITDLVNSLLASQSELEASEFLEGSLDLLKKLLSWPKDNLTPGKLPSLLLPPDLHLGCSHPPKPPTNLKSPPTTPTTLQKPSNPPTPPTSSKTPPTSSKTL
jgi:hypothetical protein